MMTDPKDYKALDQAILVAVSSLSSRQKADFNSIMADSLVDKALREFQGELNPVPDFRVVDRRLQALRKRGAIRFAGKVEGWVIA